LVSIWKARNPLTIEERRKIKEALDLGLSYRQIGKYVGRSFTTVRRETKRLGSYKNYDPELAQKDFEEKQKLVGIKKRC
jgi:IS30 family transposase